MKKLMKNKKNIYLCFIFVFCLLCLMFILLFYFRNDDNQNNLLVEFENDKTVFINNKLPMSDIAGIQLTGEGTSDDIQGYVEFSIKSKVNKKQKYTIYLNDVKVDAPIDYKYVRLYLTDFNDNPYSGFDSNIIPNYGDFSVLKDSPADKILYSGTLDGNEKKNFRLRVWVSDTYTLMSGKEEFSFKVNVKNN